MEKIRLNEKELRAIVNEAINKVMNELTEPSMGNNDRSLSRAIDAHCSSGPSPLEEEFADEFSGVIDSYKDVFLNYGWKIEDFKKWCHEMVDEAM